VRWDSPFVLAMAGTFAIHVILIVLGDAVVVSFPHRAPEQAPQIELVEIEPPIEKPKPPPATVQPPPAAPQVVASVPRTHAIHAAARPVATAVVEPPVTKSDLPPGGGGPLTIPLGDLPPESQGHHGGYDTRRPGQGSGSGGGGGAGSGGGEVRPMSVATIKTQAVPRGDYSFFSAGKDYPVEARQLGIEGVIKVRLTVDDHGKVTKRLLLNHLGHGLDELAMQRSAQIEFTPAKDSDDHPVASIVVWTFTMTLPK
jgi:TonB family protein